MLQILMEFDPALRLFIGSIPAIAGAHSQGENPSEVFGLLHKILRHQREMGLTRTILEHQGVTLLVSKSEHGLSPGAVGVVVHCNALGFIVEFAIAGQKTPANRGLQLG